jgi:hypothetical protein
VFGGRIVILIYLAIGVLIAVTKNYFDIDNIRDIVSAALAIVLWPLVLFGVNLHIGKLDDDDGRGRGLILPAVWQAQMLAERLRARLSNG